jgi:drug/metabolite transporter (DMT)-like permease
MFIVVMIAFATLATLVRYIPHEYVMLFVAIVFLGLYMGVFMVAVSLAADIYGTSVILTTLLLFWYAWIRAHPPLRQVQQ